jgi:hypothetical protein
MAKEAETAQSVPRQPRAPNRHDSREVWLRAATNELRPFFTMHGYQLPENIRFAVAFTSQGKKGKAAGEAWHSKASADDHYEIIIRSDFSDPSEILGILIAKLIHTLLPPEAKHGKDYRAIAVRLGLEGPMRHARPGPALRDRLNDLSATLGPIPHGKLDHSFGFVGRPGKQRTRMLKAECRGPGCGYVVRVTSKWVRDVGPPGCPKHGPMFCEIPEEEEEALAEDESGNAASATAGPGNESAVHPASSPLEPGVNVPE